MLLDGHTLTPAFSEMFGTLDLARWKTTYPWNNQCKKGMGTSFADVDIDAAASGYMRRTIGHDPWVRGDERQIYSDAGLGPDPFSIGPDGLGITARRITDAERAAHSRKLWGREYTSGLLTTQHSFSQATGYFEAELRFDNVPGVWPAFWLLPIDAGFADYAFKDELDIIEAYGGDLRKRHVTQHWDRKTSPKKLHKAVTLPDDGFHRHGALVTPETILPYLDGQPIEAMRQPNRMRPGVPLFMLLDLAVGGAAEAIKGPDGKRVGRPVFASARMDVRRVEAWGL